VESADIRCPQTPFCISAGPARTQLLRYLQDFEENSVSDPRSTTLSLNTTNMAIRFLVLSDTHDQPFPDTSGYSVDVVLHCGDLTQIGGLSNYRRALEEIKSIEAELKLVIPGNHDVSLDPKWWAENLDQEDDDDPEEPTKAHQLFAEAEVDGIYLLSEGTRAFTLANGKSFTIYASPYTPAFNGYAFPYSLGEDRFNHGDNPIPDNIDIVMTHGPPLVSARRNVSATYTLDLGHEGEHHGCSKLFDAVSRSRPLLHCFGHIHEGHGVQSLLWQDGSLEGAEAPPDGSTLRASLGRTTFVNAAIATHEGAPNNKPWVVEVDLVNRGAEEDQGREGVCM